MYSRYSASRETQETPILPAKYSGVRFRREKRSDGRDVVIETPMKEPEAPREEKPPEEEAKPETKENPSSLFECVGEDDLILTVLILVLAGEDLHGNREALLFLILLLCIR